MASGIESGLKVRGVENINKIFFFFLTPNTQKFCFFNTLKCVNKYSLHMADKPQQLIKTH